MTLPPVVRIFFAVELPLTAKEKITEYINVLKKKSKPNTIRWTKPENLHVTLHFLAEVNSQHIPFLLDNVKKKITRQIFHEATLKIGKIHLFPNPYRPRVIVLTLDPQEHIAYLASTIGEGILESQYAIESRPFRAHLTLGRIKYSQGVDLNFLNTCELPKIGEIPFDAVTLFRSEPQNNGSKYTPLAKIELLLADSSHSL